MWTDEEKQKLFSFLTVINLGVAFLIGNTIARLFL